MDLDATAALVMAWSSPLYDGGPVRDFFDALDLSKGEALLRRCDAICPWYGEVILNRKYQISRLVRRALARSAGPCRLVIPAAGMNPLALAVLEKVPELVTEIVEIDLSGMVGKHALYERVAPDLSARIACVPGDIATLSFSRYAGSEPTILVIEGVSYYLGRDDLRRMIGSFCSGTGKNTVIVEYLAPCQMVAVHRRAIPRGVFASIGEVCGRAPLSVYTPGAMASVIRDAGGRVDAHFSMATMERSRCGENHFFRSEEDGWIWCTKGRI